MSTMENDEYVAIRAGQQLADTGEINAMIELGEFLLTLNRTTNTMVLCNMSLEEITSRVFTPDVIGFFATVKEMANISSSRFSVLLSISHCYEFWSIGWYNLWIMQLNGDLGFRLVEEIAIAIHSSSICYKRYFIFAAVTPYIGDSYILQTQIEGMEHGPKCHTSAKLKYKHILPLNSIRILDVDPDFVMYVCDKEHNHLYVFRRDNFSDSLMISEEITHRYRVMDIARSAEGATYIATDSSDGIGSAQQKPRMNVQQFFTDVKTRRDPDRSSVYWGSASAISGCSYIMLVEMEDNKDCSVRCCCAPT